MNSAVLSGAEEVSKCPWCGETGVDFVDAERPRDYCGHDPALVRPRPDGVSETSDAAQQQGNGGVER